MARSEMVRRLVVLFPLSRIFGVAFSIAFALSLFGKLYMYGINLNATLPFCLLGLYIFAHLVPKEQKIRRILQMAFAVLMMIGGVFFLGEQIYELADPSNQALFRANRAGSEGKCKEAFQFYEKSIELNPDQGTAYNNWAWLLLTCPNKELRNAQRALELSQKAADLPGFNSAIADTVACAFAANGDFDHATTIAERFHLKDRVALFADSDICE